MFHVQGREGNLDIASCLDNIIAVDAAGISAVDPNLKANQSFEIEIQVQPL